MNKIQKMKMVGFTVASPSMAKNSKKTGSPKSPAIKFDKCSDYMGGNQ